MPSERAFAAAERPSSVDGIMISPRYCAGRWLGLALILLGALAPALPVASAQVAPGFIVTKIVASGPSSITIGSDGLGLISTGSMGGLDVTHCQDVALLRLDDLHGRRKQRQQPIPELDRDGADGLGLVAYLRGSELKVAHCNDVSCSSTLTDANARPAITTGVDGLGPVTFYGRLPNEEPSFMVVHFSNPFGIAYFRRR